MVRHENGRTDADDACTSTQQTEVNFSERLAGKNTGTETGDRDDLLAISTAMHNSNLYLFAVRARYQFSSNSEVYRYRCRNALY